MLRLVAFLLVSSFALALDLSEPVKSGDFWKQSPKESLKGIKYQRPDAEHLRTADINFGEITSGEVIISLQDKMPVSLQAMLYNKGDDGIIYDDDFHARIDEARRAMDEFTGVRGRARMAGKKDSAVKLKAWEWKWDNGIIRLETSFTGKKKNFEAEFIRLIMAADAKNLNAGGARDSVRKNELRDNIITEEDGTVWLKNIPMIDQGNKGYCLPATLARVFAFYGMDKIDQHALAAVCDSQAGGGTSQLSMEQSMEDVCKKFRTKFIILDTYSSTLKEFLGTYNKLAKRADKPTFNAYENVFRHVDAELLLQARAGKNSQINKWLKDIKKHIDAGSPIIWGVMMGIYPENNGSLIPRGAHARLIVGYNLKTKTILFSDSWGAGNERKPMPAAEALSMTMGRYVIKLR